MKRSRESNSSSQSYERIKDSLKVLLRMAEQQIELGEIAKAKSLISEAIEGARVKPLISSSIPSVDVALRTQSFDELTNLALVCGKAGGLLEMHDDRLAIDYFNHSMVAWNRAWNELDELTSKWDLTLEEVVQDDDFDCDYSLSYAFRIAECFGRLGEWQQVISAVNRSIDLSGNDDYHHYELLSEAYDELGDYDSCIQACEQVRIYWYVKDDTKQELIQICRMAVISEYHDRLQEAIAIYDKFADYYYRCEQVAGRIEFNKACLLVQLGELGRAYEVFHSSLRFFARDNLPRQDLIRCEKAIASLQDIIASGSDNTPCIESFTIEEICDDV